MEASRTVGVTVSEPEPARPADAPGLAQAGDRQPGEAGPARVTPAQESGVVQAPSRPTTSERLATVKLLLEVLMGLVALIGAILALVANWRK
jgi:hypothetical protein